MLYVSDYNEATKKYGITDTTDGVTDYVSEAEVVYCNQALATQGVKIYGVKQDVVEVVDFSRLLQQNTFAEIEIKIDSEIKSWTYTECEEVGRRLGCVSEVKQCQQIGDVWRVLKARLYPQSIKNVVDNAQQLTNQAHSVEISNLFDVKQALKNNVCLVVQKTKKGSCTAFICTGSTAIVDSLYGPYVLESATLTQQACNLADTSKLEEARALPPKPSHLLPVYSCSMRFRRATGTVRGLRVEKDNFVLSSATYTVNPKTLVAMFILDGVPAGIGANMLSKSQTNLTSNNTTYKPEVFSVLQQSLARGINLFSDLPTVNASMLPAYIKSSGLGTNIDYLNRYEAVYNELMGYRATGYSFM